MQEYHLDKLKDDTALSHSQTLMSLIITQCVNKSVCKRTKIYLPKDFIENSLYD
uniref:Uncharacterized protein n=1 Tax=Rhizophora mucronata TaxID=61149 RepID=A0A2P2QBG2_RHIMU